jgi:hypothetical protein
MLGREEEGKETRLYMQEDEKTHGRFQPCYMKQ